MELGIDFYNALEVSGRGMLGIFIFMLLFFFMIKFIDKIFPGENNK